MVRPRHPIRGPLAAAISRHGVATMESVMSPPVIKLPGFPGRRFVRVGQASTLPRILCARSTSLPPAGPRCQPARLRLRASSDQGERGGMDEAASRPCRTEPLRRGEQQPRRALSPAGPTHAAQGLAGCLDAPASRAASGCSFAASPRLCTGRRRARVRHVKARVLQTLYHHSADAGHLLDLLPAAEPPSSSRF